MELTYLVIWYQIYLRFCVYQNAWAFVMDNGLQNCMALWQLIKFTIFSQIAGCVLLFTDKLNQLKDYAESSGHGHLRELIESVIVYDEMYSKGDLSGVGKLFHQSIKSMRKLAPHLKSETLTAGAHFVAHECEKVMKKMESDGGSFKDIENLVKLTMARIKDEL